MKIYFGENGSPEELKIWLDNMKNPVVIFAGSPDGKPVISYFGDVTHSNSPLFSISLLRYKDDKGNKCAIFCGLVFDNDGSFLPLEIMVPPEKLELFLSDEIFFTFCDKIKEIKNDEVICENEQYIMVKNPLSKEFVNKLIEEMKDPGNPEEAWNNYLKEFTQPICLTQGFGGEQSAPTN